MGTLINIIGEKFDRLTVVSRSENIGTRAAWLCLCDCGNQIVADGKKLRSGHTSSCGCKRKENAAHQGRKNAASLEDINRLLVPRGISIVGEFRGVSNPCEFRCKCGKKWVARFASSVLYTTGCPVCSKKNNGALNDRLFIKNPNLASLPAHFYVVQLKGNGESFFKYGVTRQPISERFRKFYPYEADVVTLEKCSLLEAYKKECAAKEKFNNVSYRPKIHFSGYAECFSQ